jgi:hypothetical protein
MSVAWPILLKNVALRVVRTRIKTLPDKSILFVRLHAIVAQPAPNSCAELFDHVEPALDIFARHQ